MAKTYDPIATATASGSQAVITFSSIPSTFTDIILVISGNTVNSTAQLTFNNDSTALYSRTSLRGNGTSATSFLQSDLNCIPIDGSYSQPSQNAIIHVMNYSNATTFKTSLVRSNNAGAGIDQAVGLYRSTNAINRLDVLMAVNWTSGTTFTLYGIKAA